MSLSHALVLERDVRIPAYEIGRAAARALRLPLADVTRLLRRCRGILVPPGERHRVEALAAVLSDHGLRAVVIPEASLPDLPKPQAVLDADPTERGFVVQRAEGPAPPLLPWEELVLLAAGQVTFVWNPARAGLGIGIGDDSMKIGTVEEWFADMGMEHPGIGSRRHGPHITERLTTPHRPRRKPKKETVLVLDLLTHGGAERFRIVAGRFVYDYLGDRLALASSPNFRTLIRDISRFSPETLLTRSTLSLLERSPGREYRFDGPEEFDAYVRWALTWPMVFEMPS